MSFHHASVTMLHGTLWAAWALQFKLHGVLMVLAIAVILFFKGKLGGIIAAWPFFTHRYDFIRFNFQKTTRNTFSFNILDV
jgi:hypothetical protein